MEARLYAGIRCGNYHRCTGDGSIPLLTRLGLLPASTVIVLPIIYTYPCSLLYAPQARFRICTRLTGATQPAQSAAYIDRECLRHGT